MDGTPVAASIMDRTHAVRKLPNGVGLIHLIKLSRMLVA
jgi:hypothetical protein